MVAVSSQRFLVHGERVRHPTMQQSGFVGLFSCAGPALRAGNNWAHGFHGYGPAVHEDALELVRREV